MTANMKDFLAKVSENKVLAEKASKLEKAELIVLAKELGFELTEADFVQPEGEISEDELTSVTGGSICACVLGGGGKMDVRDEICACVMAGVGETTSPNARCFCFAGGYGD